MAYNGLRKPRGDDRAQWKLYFELHPEKKDDYKKEWARVKPKKRGRPPKETTKNGVPRKKVDEYKILDGDTIINIGENELVSLAGSSGRGKKFWSDSLRAVVNILTINGVDGNACINISYDLKVVPIEELNTLKLRNYNEKIMSGDSVVLNDNIKLILTSDVKFTNTPNAEKKHHIVVNGSVEKIKVI